MPYVKIENREIYYEESGDGKEVSFINRDIIKLFKNDKTAISMFFSFEKMRLLA